MISIHTDFGIFVVPFKAAMTVSQLVQDMLDKENFEIRGGYTVQETKTGHNLDPTDSVYDGRYYYLTAFTFQRRHRHP